MSIHAGVSSFLHCQGVWFKHRPMRVWDADGKTRQCLQLSSKTHLKHLWHELNNNVDTLIAMPQSHLHVCCQIQYYVTTCTEVGERY